jgi:hypothetical protein
MELKLEPRWLEATSTAVGPKRRWVDGTPEYSFYISALCKLFPGALFIHIVPDVQAVVRSMLNFHRVGGVQLVSNQQEAYHYWFRAVSACLQAERAYGPNVVYRVRYGELIDNPESAMQSLFAFLEEPYTAKCLEPLKERINSPLCPRILRLTTRPPIQQSWRKRSDFPPTLKKMRSQARAHRMQQAK